MRKQKRKDPTTQRKRSPIPMRRGVRARRSTHQSFIEPYRRELEQRDAELVILSSVQQALASKLELQAIYDLVGDKIREIFDAQVVVISTFDLASNLNRLNYLFEGGRRLFPDPYPISPFAMRLIQSRASLLVHTSGEFGQLGAAVPPGTAPVKSGIFVPLLVRGELRGGISLQNMDRENAFTETDVRLLETVASSMSVALENARLFDETQRLFKAEQQRAAELQIINSIQAGLVRKLDVNAIYELVGEELRRVFPKFDLTLGLYDPKTDTATAPYTIEHGERLYVKPFRVGGSGFTAELIRTRKTILVSEKMDEASKKVGSHTLEGTYTPKSALYVPLVVGDTFRGVVLLQDMEREHAFSDSDVRLLETIANSMSVALENARLFDEERQRAAELATVNRISQALASQLELDALIQLAGDQIRETFRADIAYIALLDHVSRVIHFPYTFGDEFTTLRYGEGLTSKIIETGQPLLINQDVETRRAEIGASRVGIAAKAYLGVPIFVGSRATGVVSVQSTQTEGRFDENDQRLLATIAANVGAAIERARLFEEVEQARRGLERELEIGREIQFSFLPDELPQPPGWEVAARFLPARQVSGDLYDVFSLQGDRKIGLVIADVCDKGVGAALYMALFRSLIRATSNLDYFADRLNGSSPSAPFSDTANLKNAVVLTNNYIARTHEHANMFATLFFGILDPATGALTYINGGHEPPLIFGAGGVKAQLPRTGMAVGLTPDASFGIADARLEPGDMLLAFTDGVVDAQNSANESFSREKLISLLTVPAPSAAALIDRIETSVREHIANADQFDDITMLAVHRSV